MSLWGDLIPPFFVRIHSITDHISWNKYGSEIEKKKALGRLSVLVKVDQSNPAKGSGVGKNVASSEE